MNITKEDISSLLPDVDVIGDKLAIQKFICFLFNIDGGVDKYF